MGCEVKVRFLFNALLRIRSLTAVGKMRRSLGRKKPASLLQGTRRRGGTYILNVYNFDKTPQPVHASQPTPALNPLLPPAVMLSPTVISRQRFGLE